MVSYNCYLVMNTSSTTKTMTEFVKEYLDTFVIPKKEQQGLLGEACNSRIELKPGINKLNFHESKESNLDMILARAYWTKFNFRWNPIKPGSSDCSGCKVRGCFYSDAEE